MEYLFVALLLTGGVSVLIILLYRELRTSFYFHSARSDYQQIIAAIMRADTMAELEFWEHQVWMFCNLYTNKIDRSILNEYATRLGVTIKSRLASGLIKSQ